MTLGEKTVYYGLGLSGRPVSPARGASPHLERFGPLQTLAETSLAQPFRGLTTDGNVIPDLFPLQTTGVSTKPIVKAVRAYLDCLTDEQRATTMFPLESDAWQRWLNIHPFVMRHGQILEDLTDAQREAALDILRAGMSASGFQQARDIMRLNETVLELTQSAIEYGEWIYYMSIFGTPSETEPWGWQMDGHHLTVCCFVVGDQIAMSPMFMGSEPLLAQTGKHAGTRVLAAEEQYGLDLAQSLSAEQRNRAVLFQDVSATKIPPERFFGAEGRIYGGAFRGDNLVSDYEGVCAADLSAGQRELVSKLLEVYTGRLRDGHKELRRADVQRHIDTTYFAWMGEVDRDDGVFYYKLQSPVIWAEFDHEAGVAFEGTEPTRNHAHTIVRTPNGNDYGKDLLRQHKLLYHAK